MEKILKEYIEVFGGLPIMPKMVNISVIADLMQDAIISKIPVNPEDIMQRVSELDEPIDLAK